MEFSVLILAAGPYRGWTAKKPCQLAKIAGKPLILRTLCQIAERGHKGVVVTHNRAIQATVPVHFVPRSHRWWIETVLETVALWGERTVLLNGDVIFSDKIMDLILSDAHHISCYGNKEEMFAVTFVKKSEHLVLDALGKAMQDAPKTISKRRGRGLCWQFYRALCGMPLHKHELETRFYRLIENDYTDDIDSSPEKYREFLRKNPWAK